jgi:hypothetical protein
MESRGKQLKTLDDVMRCVREKKAIERAIGDISKRISAALIAKWTLIRTQDEIDRGMLYEYIPKN